MKMKSIFVLFVALVFALSVAGISFAADVTGTVTKVAGSKVTVKDAAGKESTVDVKNAKDVKAGDNVTIKDGKATKGAAAPAPAGKKASSGGY